MLTKQPSRLFLARHHVDFRKGHSGLLAEAYNLGLDPYDGDGVVFIARDRRKVKLLMADSNGLWVLYKRFACGVIKTRLAFLDQPGCHSVSIPELAMLLDGARFQISGRPSDWPKNGVDKGGPGDEDL